ncbi:SNARE associated Golgi protein family [Actinidia rufa]|uniref:SNARE associated Golgi protein family n=1 Tax=Actinidia rufa TaxID=165716 RepID=A0A7J0FMH0_9ERIC|nr:SNARE associated Golgi protein family [Actinidia rufa]
MAGDSDGASSSSSSASSEQGNLSPPDSPTSSGFNTDQLPSNTSQTTPTRTRMMPPSIPMSSRTSPKKPTRRRKKARIFSTTVTWRWMSTTSTNQWGWTIRSGERDLGQIMADRMAAEMELEGQRGPYLSAKASSTSPRPRELNKTAGNLFFLLGSHHIPSYVINYALAATRVGFVVDFLLPTVIGCLPMILQNTSIGCLAGAAVASASGAKKSQERQFRYAPSLVRCTDRGELQNEPNPSCRRGNDAAQLSSRAVLFFDARSWVHLHVGHCTVTKSSRNGCKISDSSINPILLRGFTSYSTSSSSSLNSSGSVHNTSNPIAASALGTNIASMEAAGGDQIPGYNYVPQNGGLYASLFPRPPSNAVNLSSHLEVAEVNYIPTSWAMQPPRVGVIVVTLATKGVIKYSCVGVMDQGLMAQGPYQKNCGVSPRVHVKFSRQKTTAAPNSDENERKWQGIATGLLLLLPPPASRGTFRRRTPPPLPVFNTDQLPSNTSQTTPTRTRMMPPSIPMSSRTSPKKPTRRRKKARIFSTTVTWRWMSTTSTNQWGWTIRSGERDLGQIMADRMAAEMELEGQRGPYLSAKASSTSPRPRVGFVVDFLLPTVIGCLPMILQNTSIGCLAGAAVASASGAKKSQV